MTNMTPEEYIEWRIAQLNKEGDQIIVGGDANLDEINVELDVLQRAKRLPEVEADFERHIKDMRRVIAQRDALARLIMEEELDFLSGGLKDFVYVLQTEVKSILHPSWKDPLKEVVDAVMDLEPAPMSKSKDGAPSIFEINRFSLEKNIIQQLQTTIKGIVK